MIRRVIHVVPSLSVEFGGPAHVVAQLTEVLSRKGVHCTIFTTQAFRDGPPLHPKGVDSRIFPTGWLNPLWKGYSRSLAKALRDAVGDYELVHIHGLWNYPHFAAYEAAKKSNKPFIVTPHGTLDPWVLRFKKIRKCFYMSLIQRRMLKEAAAITALTRAERERIKALGFRNPVFTIPNGIHLEEFAELPPGEEFEDHYPELKGKFVILFLSRIHPKKGLDILSRSFAKIVRESKRDVVRLVIAGPDESNYRSQIEVLLKHKRVLDKVIFTGTLKGRLKLTALNRADIFVLPSYSEGFSVAILEALASGLPVIITHQCYLPEVAEAKAGIVIDPDDLQLSEALVALLDKPDLRAEMGLNGQRLVRQRFTWDKVADQLIETYNFVLKTHGERLRSQ